MAESSSRKFAKFRFWEISIRRPEDQEDFLLPDTVSARPVGALLRLIVAGDLSLREPVDSFASGDYMRSPRFELVMHSPCALCCGTGGLVALGWYGGAGDPALNLGCPASGRNLGAGSTTGGALS